MHTHFSSKIYIATISSEITTLYYIYFNKYIHLQQHQQPYYKEISIYTTTDTNNPHYFRVAQVKR